MLDVESEAILGDPEWSQQVMGTFISNAITFIPKGGQVEITPERVNSSVEVRVADKGIGIAADFLSHVFDRFRQANEHTPETS